MKKNALLIVFFSLVVSFVMTSCYVNRPYRYDRDDYWRHHHRRTHEYNNRYGRY